MENRPGWSSTRNRKVSAERQEAFIQHMNIANAGFRRGPQIALDPTQVHLLRVDLEATAPNAERWISTLSPDEQVRAGRFHHTADRERFVVCRTILRRVLGSSLSVDPKTVSIAYSAREKPYVGGNEAKAGLAFNISHSGKIALLAFARSHDVGVDVEQHRPEIDTLGIAKRFFSEAEQDQLAAMPEERRSDAFFRCWSRKESYIKAVGKGLSLPLRDFDVSLKPDDQNALLSTRPDPLERTRWSLRDLPIQPGYAAALCVSGTDWSLVDRSWQECEA